MRHPVLSMLVHSRRRDGRIKKMKSLLGAVGCWVLLVLPIAVEPAAAQQSGIDPCTLVTAGDLAAITHQKVDGPKPQATDICAWQIAGSFAITIQYNETGQAGFDNAKSLTRGAKPGPGIGDAAFVFVSVAGFDAVHVVKHGHYVVITYQGGSNAADRLQAVEAMAGKAAEQL
jgi:hypothetical protein